ncbi:MAG: hypothetical protein ACR2OE_07405 [Thermomicrobiales bacterium]
MSRSVFSLAYAIATLLGAFVLLAIEVFGTALGPLPFGFGFDAFRSYAPAILAMLILPAIAGVFVLTTRPPELETVIA